jgi:hypothetical protein
MKKRVLIGLVLAVALGMVVMGYAQALSLVKIYDLGCDDLAYKWYSDCDHIKGMITEDPDHLLPRGGSWAFEFDGDPGFKSVMVGTSEQHTSFTAGLRGGAILTIVWTPGYSSIEQLEATLDGNTVQGRRINALDGDNGQSDAKSGEPGDLWYFTEVFTFESLTDEPHSLVIRSLNGDGVGFDYIKLEAVPIEVDVDIKPGSDPNCFNSDGHGVIPVAILGSTDFDVSQIDPATVTLEDLAIRAVGKSNKLLAHIEDVNDDGFDDLVVQIEDVDGAFQPGEGSATVTGNLYDGTPIEGSDSICIRPPE